MKNTVQKTQNQSPTKAWRTFVPEMVVEWATFSPKDLSQDGPLTGEQPFETSYSAGSEIEGYFPNFPILMCGVDGLPWTLGNLYLLRRLAFNPDPYEAETYKSISASLLDYLRFLVSEQIDSLDFHPRLPAKRPTYRYNQNLRKRIREGSIAASTASQHMNRIIAFYKGLVSYGILESDVLDKMHEARTAIIPIINSTGFTKNLTISTSNLSIRAGKKASDSEYIQDGGKLKPLTINEQDDLFLALKDSERCIFLFFLFALMTGARIQTIGTIRIKNLRHAKLDKEGFYRLRVGAGTRIDTKQDKRQLLMIPASLYQALMVYIYSPIATRRRALSFYGDSDDNYLFLNKYGESYYTSKKEQQERRNVHHHRKVGLESASAHIKPKKGDAIRTFITETLLPRIRQTTPQFEKFRFHDLRATFGMNCMESYMRQMDAHNNTVKEKSGDDYLTTTWVLEQVMHRMSHSNLQTTMKYLDFQRDKQWRAKLIVETENELMQHVPGSAREGLEEL